MINPFLRNIVRFLLLLFFQIAILNNIHLGGFINPYLYILFILLLPFETPKWLLLIASFAIGISVDMFSDTTGIHAAACVFMAFCRPAVINFVSSNQGYEPGIKPIIRDLGFNWFFIYSLLLVLAHHLVLFFLEVFSLSEFFYTLYRVILSTIFTLIIIIISQYIIYRKKK